MYISTFISGAHLANTFFQASRVERHEHDVEAVEGILVEDVVEEDDGLDGLAQCHLFNQDDMTELCLHHD